MLRYNSELWIGELPKRGGYNFEIKGASEEDYSQRIIICQEMAERLKGIITFYQHLSAKKREDS